MNLAGPEFYKLKCTPTSFQVVCAKGNAGFSGVAATKQPKLYVVSVDSEIRYVGQTIRKMQDRFRSGWKAKGENGYHGYRWRHDLKEADVDIWALDNVEERDIETIEAEIVFLIRKGGQWPIGQTEIHFHVSTDKHRKIAEKIYSHYSAAKP